MTQPQSANRKPLTVGLLWHSLSSDNLGVGALTLGQLDICHAAAARAGVDLQFIIFGNLGGQRYGPQDGSVRTGSQVSIKAMLTGRSPFLRELEQCDLVLDIGEGDSYTDIYGLRRYLFFTVSKIAVLAKRIPLILSPQTIGPFDRWYTRMVAAVVMRRCTRVFARDGMSAEYLQRCGVRRNTDEVVDVAFRLPFTQAVASAGGKLRVGLNVSGLLFAGGYTGTNQFNLTLDYAALIRSLLAHWTAQADTEVWLIPHVVPDQLPRDDDRVAIRQLAQEFPGARLAPAFKSPSEAKSFISGMDFVSGARMHACIAALSSGVPVVPLAYSRKFNGLFQSLGYSRVADGKRHTLDEAREIILQASAMHRALRAEVAAAVEVARTKLMRYEDDLVKTFRSALGRRGDA